MVLPRTSFCCFSRHHRIQCKCSFKKSQGVVFFNDCHSQNCHSHDCQSLKRQEWLTAANGFKNKDLTLVQPTIKAQKSRASRSLQLPPAKDDQVTMPCTRQHMVVMQHCVLGCRSAQKPFRPRSSDSEG